MCVCVRLGIHLHIFFQKKGLGGGFLLVWRVFTACFWFCVYASSHSWDRRGCPDFGVGFLQDNQGETAKCAAPMLWTDEILHHLRNPGMMIPPVNTNKSLNDDSPVNTNNRYGFPWFVRWRKIDSAHPPVFFFLSDPRGSQVRQSLERHRGARAELKKRSQLTAQR